MHSFYDSYDFFAAPMPTFNMQGKPKRGTFLGCLLTFIAGIILVGALAIRLLHTEASTSNYFKW